MLPSAFGIDGALIECLEAFEKWYSEPGWETDYDSAKAAWLAAWNPKMRDLRPDQLRVMTATGPTWSIGKE